MAWQQRLYNLIYRRAQPRWDTGVIPPEIVDLVEGDHALAPGRALDMGCGTGTYVVYLAQHGWEAVGVDFSSVALRTAREKAKGMPGAAFVEADVTRLTTAQVQGPFDLVLDFGCFHGIALARRDAYVQVLVRVTRPGALYLLYAIDSARRSWLPSVPRADEAEIRLRFGGAFTVVTSQPVKGRWPARFYVMRRNEA